jgi:hypothetical protein
MKWPARLGLMNNVGDSFLKLRIAASASSRRFGARFKKAKTQDVALSW